MSNFRIIAVAALPLVFVISVVWFVVAPRPMERRLLMFPDTAGGAAHAEWHHIPRRESAEASIRMFVEELSLGPVELGAVPFIPDGTSIRSLAVNDGVLYLDFSPDVMFGNADSEGSFSTVDDWVRLNLRHNFRSLERIVLLIDGQVPDAPGFEEIGR